MILFSEVISLDENEAVEANYDFVVELTRELLETVLSRQSLFLSTKEVDKRADEIHFEDDSGRVLRDTAYSPSNFMELHTNGFIVVDRKAGNLFNEVAALSEQYMIISEQGVTWIANVDVEDSLVTSRQIPYEEIRKALGTVCSRP